MTMEIRPLKNLCTCISNSYAALMFCFTAVLVVKSNIASIWFSVIMTRWRGFLHMSIWYLVAITIKSYNWKEKKIKWFSDDSCREMIQDYEDVKVRFVNILTLSILSVLSFIIEAWANLSNIALKIFLLWMGWCFKNISMINFLLNIVREISFSTEIEKNYIILFVDMDFK